jgi:hypothetical protein
LGNLESQGFGIHAASAHPIGRARRAVPDRQPSFPWRFMGVSPDESTAASFDRLHLPKANLDHPIMLALRREKKQTIGRFKLPGS